MQAETLFILKKPGLYVDVNAWSKTIGLEPLRCTLRGDPITVNNQTKAAPDSDWIFGITRCDTPSMESQLAEVVDKIHAKKDAIKRVVANYGVSLICETAAWFGDEDAFIDFGHDIFKKLAAMGASFQLKYCV